MSALFSQFVPLAVQLLQETGAQSVLVNNAEAAAICGSISACRACPADQLLREGWEQRADLAVAILAIGDRTHAAAYIAALRDLHARRVLLFVPVDAFEWKPTTLLSLGFSHMASYEIEGAAWQAWTYDIRSYKSVPDWLNPRFWANPENWGKFRW